MIDKEVLDRAVAFHGHLCPGLLIGVRTAMVAQRYFGDGRSVDEELFCIAENHACGIDALQLLLGTTAGKGNLFFREHGKQAVTVGSRQSGKAIRISFKRQGYMSRSEKGDRLMSLDDQNPF
ncbi:MAG: formylmethanofuran dehydrogenase subunit E family protein, partial [Chloroflexi bacterium]|nr:formylmethanofuran dehydrogenase subunit E family protein [Chloroflexota bacterium]